MHDFEEPQISRRIAMVAHDNKKVELLRWAEFNVGHLRHHQLFATGTTGTISSPLMTGDYMPSRPIMDRPSTGAEYLASSIA